MAGRKVRASLSPISKQIKRTQKKLRSLKKKVSAKHKKTIQANITALDQLNKQLGLRCRSMDLIYPAK